MIRPAEERDLPAILHIYEAARAYMEKTGNPNQWTDGYPGEALLREDIRRGELFVVQDETGRACGAFVLMGGEEPVYARIDGRWHSDAPYGTIHRIASDGSARGVFAAAIEFARARHDVLRIDTHEDNRVMQSLVEKSGFAPCGVVNYPGPDPDAGRRLAYDWVKEEEYR